jgi:HNH endonuclease
MFGVGFEDCWYKVPAVLSLELSGDLRFRGPRGLRQVRYDRNGRPYVIARKLVGPESDGWARSRVMLHRAVISLVLGRRLGCDELVCHRDDDPRNNWPDNLYLGDHASNVADSLRNGGRLRGDKHPCTKILDAQVREIRLALFRGERGVDLARAHGVHRSTISRIWHGVRRGSSFYSSRDTFASPYTR